MRTLLWLHLPLAFFLVQAAGARAPNQIVHSRYELPPNVYLKPPKGVEIQLQSWDGTGLVAWDFLGRKQTPLVFPPDIPKTLGDPVKPGLRVLRIVIRLDQKGSKFIEVDEIDRRHGMFYSRDDAITKASDGRTVGGFLFDLPQQVRSARVGMTIALGQLRQYKRYGAKDLEGLLKAGLLQRNPISAAKGDVLSLELPNENYWDFDWSAEMSLKTGEARLDKFVDTRRGIESRSTVIRFETPPNAAVETITISRRKMIEVFLNSAPMWPNQ